MSVEGSRRALRADTRRLGRIILAALADKKAEDVVVLDIGSISSLADLFVVASGTSARHIETLYDEVLARTKDAGFAPFGTEGEGTGWLLIDYGDIVVHLFLPETREFYELERLWLDAPRLELAAGELSRAVS